jgi:hypothetical protein
MEKLITILFIMIFGFSSLAQLPLNSVDFKRIAQKKVRQWLGNNIKTCGIFQRPKIACYSEQDSSSYTSKKQSFHKRKDPKRLEQIKVLNLEMNSVVKWFRLDFCTPVN